VAVEEIRTKEGGSRKSQEEIMTAELLPEQLGGRSRFDAVSYVSKMASRAVHHVGVRIKRFHHIRPLVNWRYDHREHLLPVATGTGGTSSQESSS
jgi:hypothetical protein